MGDVARVEAHTSLASGTGEKMARNVCSGFYSSLGELQAPEVAVIVRESNDTTLTRCQAKFHADGRHASNLEFF